MSTQAKINRQGQKYINGLRVTARQLWIKACEFDGIPSESKFVVFSDGNKFVPFYDKAHNQLMEAISQYKAGGYVGLKIGR